MLASHISFCTAWTAASRITFWTFGGSDAIFLALAISDTSVKMWCVRVTKPATS